jgi:hypothetical protein
MWCTKTAVLALYLRVFDTVVWMRRTCWVTIILLAMVYGSTVPIYLRYFVPYGKEKWDVAKAVRASEQTDIPILVTASFTLASDVFLLVLPMPVIRKLRITSGKRRGLYAVFATGVV